MPATKLTSMNVLQGRKQAQAKIKAYWTPERRQVESDRAREQWKLRKGKSASAGG